MKRDKLQRIYRMGIYTLLVSGLFWVNLAGAAVSEDLTQLSLEDLMNIRVTSVSRKSQRLTDAPAAVFVITADDIRRSGSTSVAEALRMVPGLQVAKIDANKWAVTARGFNGRFANKLLVLLDGRSVYTPWFSGVFWETLDTVLEDIDRIEVIRGPGASLWGANAVNGVINIITKDASKTQGLLLKALSGTEERLTGTIRYGLGQKSNKPFRLYLKYINRDAGAFSDGERAADDWHVLSGGFRMDWKPSRSDKLLVESGFFDGKAGTTAVFPQLQPPYSQRRDVDDGHKGYHLLTRWERTYSPNSDFALQFYYDHEDRFPTITHAWEDIYDFDFQHRFGMAGNHEVVWGMGYRHIYDHVDDNPVLFYINPSRRSQNIFSAFVQDEIDFFKKRLNVILGSKFEYNDFTHFEVEPTARVMWKIAANHSLWAAISRAVRTPSRGERDSNITYTILPATFSDGTAPPSMVTVFRNDNLESETLTAYEAGYRFRSGIRFSLDLSVYYNDYHNLRATVPGKPFEVSMDSSPFLVLPYTLENYTDGQLYGLELASNWQITNFSRLQMAYTYMLPNLKSRTTPSEGLGYDLENPRHEISARLGFDLPRRFTLDFWWRYVDELGDLVDGYHTLDVRLGWKPTHGFEMALVGQNLIENRHPEFTPEFFTTCASEVQRGGYIQLIWKF